MHATTGPDGPERGGDDDPFALRRFVQTQAPVFGQVLQELESGCKRSHWMWYVFPQLRGLGRSPTSARYGLGGAAEARAYLKHPLLGPRLRRCTELLLRIEDRTAGEILGSPDDLKLRSCMTLFAALPGAPPVFAAALERFFGGTGDPATLATLARAPSAR